MPWPGAKTKPSATPSDQRDRRHHLEIDQRLAADPPDFLQIARARDAMHDHAEHDRRDDHRDQLQERVAENFQLHRESRRERAERYTGRESEENLNKQRAHQRT